MVTGTKQIPNLPQGSSIIGWEPFETVQNGFSVKVTAAQIAAYAGGSAFGLNARTFGAVGNGTTDDTAALQAWINAGCLANPGGPGLYLPSGTYKITAPLSVPFRYLQMFGDGRYESLIAFSGVTGGCLVWASMFSASPVIRDIGLVGNTSSGRGFDFTAVTSVVYHTELKNIWVQTGGECLYIPGTIFSSCVQNFIGFSYNSHTFLAGCGPAVSWIDLYAQRCGDGKAGYRMAGDITLIGCNGLDQGDYWSIFGQAASGSFQEFPGPDSPAVTLINCNVENFASGGGAATASGIFLPYVHRSVEMIGGKFERDLSTSYHSIVRVNYSQNGATGLVKLGPSYVFLTGGASVTSYLFADVAAPFMDTSGVLIQNAITTWRQSGIDYPLLSMLGSYDQTTKIGLSFNHLQTDYLFTKGVVGRSAAPTITANVLTIDLLAGTVFNVTNNANITTFMINNAATAYLGQTFVNSFTLIMTANGTGFTQNWGASVKWPAGVAPTLTTTNGKVDIFTFITNDGGTTWYAFIVGQNL